MSDTKKILESSDPVITVAMKHSHPVMNLFVQNLSLIGQIQTQRASSLHMPQETMRLLNHMRKDPSGEALRTLWRQTPIEQVESKTHTSYTTGAHTHTQTLTFAHLLTLITLIWHSNTANWQQRHAALTNQTWFTLHTCFVCQGVGSGTGVCLSIWEEETSRGSWGSELYILKVSHVMSFICTLPLSSPTHT